MSIAATEWAANLDINLTLKGAVMVLAEIFNPNYYDKVAYVNYPVLQKRWHYGDLHSVNRMLKQLRQKGLIEAWRSPDPTHHNVLQFRLLMPQEYTAKKKTKVSALQKSQWPGSQDQQDDIRGMAPVILETEWSEDEQVPSPWQKCSTTGADLPRKNQSPGQKCSRSGADLPWSHAHFERPNPVNNPVGGGTPVRNLANDLRDGAGERSLLTRSIQPENNDDGNRASSTSLQPIFHLYQQNIEPLVPMLRSNIEVAVDRYSTARVAEAIKIAVNKGPSGRNWRYIEGILHKLASEGKKQPQRSTGNKYEDDYTSRFGGHNEETEPVLGTAEADPAAQQLWEQVVVELQEQVPLTGARAVRMGERSIMVEVPTRSNQVVLERRHYRAIQQSLERVTGTYLDISFVLGRLAQVT